MQLVGGLIMDKPKKTMSGPVTIVSTLMLLAIALRSFFRMTYWWDHANPVFAIGQGAVATLTAFLALAFGASLFPSKEGSIHKEGAMSRFYSQDSPFLPTAVGLILSITGAYGMLVLVNEENEVTYLTFFGALLGIGLYVLKRTFSVED